MSRLPHVEIKKMDQTSADRQRADRAIGVMQPSCITPDSQQSLWRNGRGGVVGHGDRLRPGPAQKKVVAFVRDPSVRY